MPEGPTIMTRKIAQFGCAVLFALLAATSASAQYGSYYGPHFSSYTPSLYRQYGPFFTMGGPYGPSMLFYPRMYSYHGANRTRYYAIDPLRAEFNAERATEDSDYIQWLRERKQRESAE
jgi:hypothetical protein